MKPILFNTDMVRAIRAGHKTVTRRVVTPRHCDSAFNVPCKPPYRPGDTLYVRETWAAWSRTYGAVPVLYYKADGDAPDGIKWRPSIHMPREAARIFLRVTDVRVERLQDITEEQARAEGCSPIMITIDVEKPDNEKEWHEWGSALPGFIQIWDSTIKPADHDLYGWDANPWVWVIEFEQISREEANP